MQRGSDRRNAALAQRAGLGQEAADLAERRAAEALVAGCDEAALDLLPALCHRRHVEACRLAVLRRADLYIREVPHA